MDKRIITTAIMVLMVNCLSFSLEAAGARSNHISLRFSLGIATGIDKVEDSTDTYNANDYGGLFYH